MSDDRAPVAPEPRPEKRSGWRYQPVITTPGDPIVTLCEVFLDAEDRLLHWTEEPAMIPQGETVEELSRDLVWMLAATWKWVPVYFSSLRVGMTFEGTGVDVEPMIAAMTKARLRQMT